MTQRSHRSTDAVAASRAGRLSRRTFTAGAAAAMAAGSIHGAGAQATPSPVSATPGASPAAGGPQILTPSAQTYPLAPEKVTFTVLVTDAAPRDPNLLTQWYENLTNVHIEWIVVPEDGAVEALTLRLASGDLPDMIMGFLWVNFTTTQLTVYGDQGIFVDLKDLIAANAPTLQTVAAEMPAALQLVRSPSGAIYAMPQINDCYHCSLAQKMWVNKAWLDKLGLAMPTTPAEFKTMLEAFRDGDPNGDGQPISPMITSAVDTLGDLDAFLMNPFQLSPRDPYPWLYVDGEGRAATAYTQEGWREGVKYLRDLYANGLLDNQSFNLTIEQVLEMGSNPDVARFGAIPTFWKVVYLSSEVPYWKDFVAVPQLTGPAGLQQTYKSYNHPGVAAGLMITSACPDPALAVRWADGLYSTEATLRVARGEPGYNWDWAAPEMSGIYGGPAIWQILETPEEPPSPEYENTGWSENSPMYFSLRMRNGQAAVLPRDEETETILYDATKQAQEPFQMPPESGMPQLFFTIDQANILSLNGVGVDDLVRQQFSTWVTGQGDPDAEWESYLEQLRSVGYDDVLGAYQGALEASQGGG